MNFKEDRGRADAGLYWMAGWNQFFTRDNGQYDFMVGVSRRLRRWMKL